MSTGHAKFSSMTITPSTDVRESSCLYGIIRNSFTLTRSQLWLLELALVVCAAVPTMTHSRIPFVVRCVPTFWGELHATRLASAGQDALVKFDWAGKESALPSGVMVDFPEEPSDIETFSGAYLIWDGCLRKWSWEGYGPPLPLPAEGVSLILTPACVVDCLRGGYRPVHCPFVAGIDDVVRPWQDPPHGRADVPPSHLQLTDLQLSEWKQRGEAFNPKGSIPSMKGKGKTGRSWWTRGGSPSKGKGKKGRGGYLASDDSAMPSASASGEGEMRQKQQRRWTSMKEK
eukprot:gnl/MRDRNA2_/MRDRNA2_57430_c0_seq2.p1 gnl/MRDRNA2_/MRDRNA2_57430_c0~~gnl/MRDRNA2_/MRDRNA2_57430_c0_seq2.p1  ORF type:complete len:287 (-),score=29.45 gnl/MRDRNA2_/MRDRNA2_57430_c0_seq2:167-1027(-)